MATSQDNLGGNESFTPLCAYNDDYSLHNEVAVHEDGTESLIATAAFKMDFIFATNMDWFNVTDYEEVSGRNLGKSQCSPRGNQECCSADAFNGLSKDEKTQKKAYCKSIGCKRCPKKKKKRIRRRLGRHRNWFRAQERSLIDQDLYDTDFNLILGEYTELKPNSTGAVLNATNVDDLAICRASNYNVTEYETPTLGCGEYLKFDCEANDYIVVQSNDTNATNVCLPEVRC